MQIPSAKPEHPTGNVYLDFAAATPMDPRVVDAMIPYFTEKFYNPSAPYALSRQVRDEVERARAVLAHAIGARPGNVVLTAHTLSLTPLNMRAFLPVQGFSRTRHFA